MRCFLNILIKDQYEIPHGHRLWGIIFSALSEIMYERGGAPLYSDTRTTALPRLSPLSSQAWASGTCSRENTLAGAASTRYFST